MGCSASVFHQCKRRATSDKETILLLFARTLVQAYEDSASVDGRSLYDCNNLLPCESVPPQPSIGRYYTLDAPLDRAVHSLTTLTAGKRIHAEEEKTKEEVMYI